MRLARHSTLARARFEHNAAFALHAARMAFSLNIGNLRPGSIGSKGEILYRLRSYGVMSPDRRRRRRRRAVAVRRWA